MRRWCCFLGCLLVCLVIQVSAQTATPTIPPLPTDDSDLTPTFAPLLVITATPLPPDVDVLTFTTYTAKDRSFAFDYPTNWVVAEEEYYTSFTAPLAVGEIAFTVFNPRVVTALSGAETDEASALDSLRQYFAFIPETISPTTVSWRKGAIAPLAPDGRSGGVAMLLQMSQGGYGLVFVITSQGQLNGFLPLIDIMIRRYDSPGSRRLATREQLTLSTFDGPREGVIAGLITQKIIKPDVTLLDNIEAFDLSGQSAPFKAISQRLPANSVMMMGRMTFRPQGSGAYESCAFLLHTVRAEADDTDQTMRHYLEVGLDQAGTLYYFDAGRNEDNIISADLRPGVDVNRSHAFVILLTNERMTVYLDGVNVADNVLVRGVAGEAGLSLRPAVNETECAFSNVALYLITPLPAGLCTAAPRVSAVTRIAPRTNAPTAGQITAEAPQQVMAYFAPARSNLRWWKLDDGTWLREDSVEESGDCDNIPIAN